MITEQTSKFRKTVAAMLAAGTLASPAAAGGLKDKFIKPKPKTQQVVQNKNTVNYLSTISDKLEDNYDDNQNDKNLQVTPMKDFLEDLIDKEGADTVKAAIDLLNTDYYHLSIDGHDGRSYSAWKKLYDSMITEDVLEEEISKRITKKLDKLEKLATKFDKQAKQAADKLTAYLEKRKDHQFPASKYNKVKKIALQIHKARQELENVKELKKFNYKTNPISKEDAKKLEKEIMGVMKETKRQIKDSMDDPIIKTILRDAGVLSIFIGLPTILSAIMFGGTPILGPAGVAIGVYDTHVTHHNREVRRYRALGTQEKIKYYFKKEPKDN